MLFQFFRIVRKTQSSPGKLCFDFFWLQLLEILLCEFFSHLVFKKTVVQTNFQSFTSFSLKNSIKQKLMSILCFATQMQFKISRIALLIAFWLEGTHFPLLRFIKIVFFGQAQPNGLKYFSSVKHIQFVSVLRWRLTNYVFVFVSRFGTTVDLVLIRLTTVKLASSLSAPDFRSCFRWYSHSLNLLEQ